jgi:hypothetical protein
MRSVRDSDANSKMWQKNRDIGRAVNSVMQATDQNTKQIQKLRRRIVGGVPGGSSVQDFKIVSDGGDYYNCYTFDGLTAGAAIIKVAKHQDLRCILPTATPAGGAWPTKVKRTITYTYTYTPTAGTTTDGVNVIEYVLGVSGSDASSETNYVTPCLNVGDIITADATTFAGPATLVGVLWKAQADGRAWAK